MCTLAPLNSRKFEKGLASVIIKTLTEGALVVLWVRQHHGCSPIGFSSSHSLVWEKEKVEEERVLGGGG